MSTLFRRSAVVLGGALGGGSLWSCENKAPKNVLRSTFLEKGYRDYMEDELFTSEDGTFAAVFDGHGGAHVSRFLRKYIYETYLKNLAKHADEPTDSAIISGLSETLEQLHEQVVQRPQWNTEGSTAVLVHVGADKVYTANVGDSRAVLCTCSGKAVELTRDHKPNDLIERERIEQQQGRVRWHGWTDPDGRPIPSMGSYRINDNLAVARCIGDKDQQPYVSHKAEVRAFRLADMRAQAVAALEDDGADGTDGSSLQLQRAGTLSPTTAPFIVLASDGLWDVFESQEAVDFVKKVLYVDAQRQRQQELDAAAQQKQKQKQKQQEASGGGWVFGTKGERQDSGSGESTVAGLTSEEETKQQMAKFLVEEAIRRGTLDNVASIVLWL